MTKLRQDDEIAQIAKGYVQAEVAKKKRQAKFKQAYAANAERLGLGFCEDREDHDTWLALKEQCKQATENEYREYKAAVFRAKNLKLRLRNAVLAAQDI